MTAQQAKQAVKNAAASGAFTATLSGSNLKFKLTFSKLTGPATMAHIKPAAPAPIATTSVIDVEGHRPLVPKLYLGTGLSAQLCCCLFPLRQGIGNGVASASAFPNGVWERGRGETASSFHSFVIFMIFCGYII